MIGIDYEKSFTAYVCWRQMHGELYRGMVFYAMMLRNRADAGWFDGSIYLNALTVAREEGLNFDDGPDPREPQFQQLLQAMDKVFDNNLPDKTGNALYCAHKSTQDSIAGEITTQVGQFIFFRS
jgi:hypothetical protein